MNRSARILAVVAALFAGALVVHPLSAQALGPVESPWVECDSEARLDDLHQYDGNALDLKGCQENCRSIYGFGLYFGGGGGDGRNVGYAVCIQDCNTRYWKAWDKDMRDLGKDTGKGKGKGKGESKDDGDGDES